MTTEYAKLFFGVGMIIVFVWILLKNRKRSGFDNALLRLDTLMLVTAGIYLVVDAVRTFI